MTGFKDIGAALRWLRNQRSKKQREVARAAGITPAMLSAYETGKHRPSLDTAERVLAALNCDVVDLTNALQIVKVSEDAFQGSEERPAAGAEGRRSSAPIEERIHALIRHQGDAEALTQEEEAVLSGLLSSMVQLMRYLRK
jgi:transcriptional regulator with XRE-family HTH domain